MSPYTLVYGKEARLPVSVELPADMLDEELMSVRLAQLNELEEKRRDALHKIENHQTQIKGHLIKRHLQGISSWETWS